MTHKKRAAQLDELKAGISEAVYTVERYSPGIWTRPAEVFTFETLQAALEKYQEMSVYIRPGYLKIQAHFDVSIYDY